MRLSIVVIVALSTFFLILSCRGDGPIEQSPNGDDSKLQGWSASVAYISNGSNGSVTVQIPGEPKPQDLEANDSLSPGSMVVTDTGSRVGLAIKGGGEITVDHSTEMMIVPGRSRALRVNRGRIVVSRPHVEVALDAEILLPTGMVTLKGTKVGVIADDEESVVTVSRGRVEVLSEGGTLEARAGQEILLPKGGKPIVIPSRQLEENIGWSDLSDLDVEVGRGIGTLTGNVPGTDNERALQMTDHRVQTTIDGAWAYTEVTEVFRNPTGETLEGVYRFPMPQDADISRLALKVGNRLMEGEFLATARAEYIFKDIIRTWRDPALLKWTHGNRFELRIFPIEPKSSREVTIGYVERLKPTWKGYRYTYPLPNGPGQNVEMESFSFRADVKDRDVGDLSSLGYAMTDASASGNTAVELKGKSFVSAGDLVLDVARTPSEDITTVAYSKPGNTKNKAYAAITIRPTLPVDTADIGPKDILIIADTSYSRFGAAADLQTRLIDRMATEMDPQDRLAVIACAHRCVPVHSPGFHRPGQRRAAELKEAWQEISIGGATNHIEALRVADAIFGARDQDNRSRRPKLIYLTDGIATTGELDLGRLSEAARSVLTRAEARLTVVDLGGDSDPAMQRALAEAGRGTVVRLDRTSTLTSQALQILRYQYGGALTDVQVETSAGLDEVYPHTFPALTHGDEIVLTARHAGTWQGNVTVKGLLAGQPFSKTYPVTSEPSTEQRSAIAARAWAGHKIRDLESHGDKNRKEIVKQSQTHGILSRHTALLALESNQMMSEYGVRARDRIRWRGGKSVAAPPVQSGKSKPRRKPQSIEEKHRVTGAKSPLQDALFAAGDGVEEQTSGTAEFEPPGDEAPTVAKPAPNTPNRSPTKKSKSKSALMDVIASEAGSLGNGSGTKGLGDSFGTASSGIGDFSSRSKSFQSKSDMGRRYRRPVYRNERLATVTKPKPPTKTVINRLDQATRRAASEPESRDRRRTLIRSLIAAEKIDDAIKESGRWSSKNPMDAEAILQAGQLSAYRGEMVNALISLDNATDAYPRAKWVLKRVQRAYEILGHSSMVCAYRVARQSLEKQKATLNIQDCPLISDVKTLAIPAQPNTFVSEVEERRQKGELRVDLSWDGQADLDLFVVEPRGRMLWWLSPRRNIRHFGVVGSGPEHIEMPTLPDGTWRVYALRRAGSTGEVNATVTVNARGTKKTLKFAILDGETKAIAEVVATTKRVKVSGPTRAKFNFHISTPDGPVKKSTIQKVFRRRRATLVHCFDRVHSPYSGRRFHTELEIDLSKSGRVSSADLVPSKSVPNREISECMRRKIKRFRFPSGDAETTFRIKLKARSAQ